MQKPSNPYKHGLRTLNGDVDDDVISYISRLNYNFKLITASV